MLTSPRYGESVSLAVRGDRLIPNCVCGNDCLNQPLCRLMPTICVPTATIPIRLSTDWNPLASAEQTLESVSGMWRETLTHYLPTTLHSMSRDITTVRAADCLGR